MFRTSIMPRLDVYTAQHERTKRPFRPAKFIREYHSSMCSYRVCELRRSRSDLSSYTFRRLRTFEDSLQLITLIRFSQGHKKTIRKTCAPTPLYSDPCDVTQFSSPFALKDSFLWSQSFHLFLYFGIKFIE